VNMNLKYIADSLQWHDIEKFLIERDTKDDKDGKQNLPGYEKVLEELKTLTPQDSELIIIMEHVVEDHDEWDNIHALDPTDNETYAIEFTPWEEWLGMEIDWKSLAEFGPQRLLAMCIWEMTWAGFTQEEIRARLDELSEPIPEGETIPYSVVLEQLKKKLNK